MAYSIDLLDENGQPLIPGRRRPHYRSSTPLPIPDVGETVQTPIAHDEVVSRTFIYESDPDDETEANCLVSLFCAKTSALQGGKKPRQ